MFANQPPQLVCIRTLTGSGLPFPSTPPLGRWGDEFLVAISRQRSAFSQNLQTVVGRLSFVVSKQPTTNHHRLSLAELEALACALLSVLLTLFCARVTCNHALGLELPAELRIKFHQSARDSEAHCVGLSGYSAAAYIGEDIESRRTVSRDQRPLRGNALRRRHKILVERLAVDFEFAAARAKKNARDRHLAAAGSVVLN